MCPIIYGFLVWIRTHDHKLKKVDWCIHAKDGLKTCRGVIDEEEKKLILCPKSKGWQPNGADFTNADSYLGIGVEAPCL